MTSWVPFPSASTASRELRCEANEGYALWEDTFNVNRDTTATGFDIDLGHGVDDQPIPLLATEATDRTDGDHALSPEGTVTVVDEVTYANLVPGRSYTVKGALMDKSTGRPLIADGSEVTSEKEFAPIGPLRAREGGVRLRRIRARRQGDRRLREP